MVVRLSRFGCKNKPFFDSRSPRDGKHLEVLGYYNPLSGTMGSFENNDLSSQAKKIVNEANEGKSANGEISSSAVERDISKKRRELSRHLIVRESDEYPKISRKRRNIKEKETEAKKMANEAMEYRRMRANGCRNWRKPDDYHPNSKAMLLDRSILQVI